MSYFGDNLERLLAEKGMSQSELSRRSGIGTSAINTYLRDGVVPSFTKAIAIADALECTLDELAGRQPVVSYRSVSLDGLSKEGRKAVEDFAEFTRKREVAEWARRDGGAEGQIA